MNAKIKSHGKVSFEIILNLSEIEARALEAITLYGTDNFLKTFYNLLGKSYLRPYEQGIHSLFKTIKMELPQHLESADNARKAFTNKGN